MLCLSVVLASKFDIDFVLPELSMYFREYFSKEVFVNLLSFDSFLHSVVLSDTCFHNQVFSLLVDDGCCADINGILHNSITIEIGCLST